MLDHFDELLRHGEFVKAHSALEDAWRAMDKSDPLRAVFKGFINGASTMALMEMGRSSESFQKTWDGFLKGCQFVDETEIQQRLRLSETLLLEIREEVEKRLS